MNNIIKPDTKIRILSEEHSEYVQKLAFEQGYHWIGGKEFKKSIPFLYFESDMNLYHSDEDYFNNPPQWDAGTTEIFIPMPEASPTPPFKIRNADHPAVRQWLKDVGHNFIDGCDILNEKLNDSFGYVLESGNFATYPFEDSLRVFNEHPYPELTLNLAITSWSLPDPVDSAKQERVERIKVIEAELAKLKQLDE